MSEPTKSPVAQSLSPLFLVLAVVVSGAIIAPGWSQTPPAQTPPTQQPQSQGPDTAQPPAQTEPGTAAPSAAPAEPTPAPRENPGLINEIGKLLKAPGWELPKLKNPFEHHDGSLSLGGLSAGGPSRLSTVVKGRTICPVSANGAPDCKAASDKLCQSKGFKEGKSLDTDASQSCSARVFIPGRKREEGDCRTENFVTQALCQ